jgi:hypothetical protein
VLSEQALAEVTPTLMQDSLSEPSRKPGHRGEARSNEPGFSLREALLCGDLLVGRKRLSRITTLQGERFRLKA